VRDRGGGSGLQFFSSRPHKNFIRVLEGQSWRREEPRKKKKRVERLTAFKLTWILTLSIFPTRI